MRWHLVKDLPVNDSIPFHFPKCLNEHLFADTRHEALEFAKTTCPTVHLPQDQCLPLAADDVKRRNQATRITRIALLLFHDFPRTYIFVGTLLYCMYLTIVKSQHRLEQAEKSRSGSHPIS